MNVDKKTRLSYIEGSLSIVVNTSLFALKLWAGIISNSVAITADAWHTLSDSISSIVLLVGAKISKRPADCQHPFGHGRAEVVSAFIIGFLLLFVGYEFVIRSVDSLMHESSSIFSTLAIVVTMISIITKELLAQYAFYAFRKTNSKALKADAWHHRSDALSSMVILIGIFVGKYYWWIDGILGFIVAGFILHAAFVIIKDNVSAIMGETPSDEFVNELKLFANEWADRDLDLHHIHIHKYGDHSELTFHIILPPEMHLKEAHKIATKIEVAVSDKFKCESTIHIEPFKK